MKKVLWFIILILIIVLNYPYLKREYQISKLQPYYKDLAEKCKEKESFSCCFASVKAMSAGNYKLLEDGCMEGYMGNMLKCVDTYQWCEPA